MSKHKFSSQNLMLYTMLAKPFLQNKVAQIRKYPFYSSVEFQV